MRDAAALDRSQWGIGGDDTPGDALRRRLAAPPAPFNTPLADRLTPLSELPTSVQARVRAQQADWRELQANLASSGANPEPIREDGVIVSPKTRLAVIIPGAGTVSLSDSADISPAPIEGVTDEDARFSDAPWSMANLTPPDETAVLPVHIPAERFPKRLLAVSVRTAAEAREAARIADARGFTALVLTAADGMTDPLVPLVDAAAQAAPHLSLYAQVLPFRGKKAPPDQYDRNLLGETYDVSLRRPAPIRSAGYPRTLDDTDPNVAAGPYVAVGGAGALSDARSHFLTLLSAAPRLAGIFFTDTAPPGYGGEDSGDNASPYHQLGYNPAARLAFLREAGADPEDLSPLAGDEGRYGQGDHIPYLAPRLTLPFLPDLGSSVANAQELYPRWRDFRHKRLLAATASLLGAIRTEKPKAELLIQRLEPWHTLEAWREGTEAAPDPATPRWVPFVYSPRTPPGVAPMHPGERFARQVAPLLAWYIAPPKPGDDGKTAAPSVPFAGLLLDLSAAPFADAEDLLKNIVITPAPAGEKAGAK